MSGAITTLAGPFTDGAVTLTLAEVVTGVDWPAEAPLTVMVAPPADTPASSPARTLAFVDAVLEGVTRLVLRDAGGEWRSFNLPRSVLPVEAREGTWIELGVSVSAPPPEAEQAEALRARLGRADKGRDISL